MEYLCKLLHCTPNELLVYKPDSGKLLNSDPLKELRRPEDTYESIVNLLYDVKPSLLKEIKGKIEELKKSK